VRGGRQERDRKGNPDEDRYVDMVLGRKRARPDRERFERVIRKARALEQFGKAQRAVTDDDRERADP